MEQEILRLDSSLEYKLICQGNTAEIFLYDETKILKLFRKNFPLEIIATEFDVARQISSDLIFVPKVFELVAYKNRYGSLYEKINGSDMIADMFRKPYKIGAYSKALANVHARIHTATLDLNSDVKSKLATNINATADLSQQEKEKIISCQSR